MERYAHIIESKRHLADLPDQDRIHICRHDFWIETERLKPFFERLKNILYTDGQHQVSCIFGHGLGGEGKTAVYERLQVMSSFTSDKMIFVELTESLDRYSLHEALLAAFGLPLKKGRSTTSLTEAAVRVMSSGNIKALVLDEINDGLLKAYSVKRTMLSLLKSLSAKKMKLCVIAFGNDSAFEIMKIDPAIGRRFVDYKFPLWEMGEDFVNFISTYEANLPLRLPSNLADVKLRTLIFTRSYGIMDNVVKIMKSFAMDAIATGVEKITADQFDRMGEIVSLYGYAMTVHQKTDKPELVKSVRYTR
ncbi:TniB family NTP-binding protein [Pseudomonas shirazica]|uniref:TniB family NTP-binding protein n=1 Tax=Pseudomonas shirazica TaxID=1940636 RepID=A0ABY9SV21_9PSED|nr:TniB family NTP-binding protein [Pseudomonas shirazica]WMY87437.1 TniB family NTP-binding protein [Pseudomonas shirazica]